MLQYSVFTCILVIIEFELATLCSTATQTSSILCLLAVHQRLLTIVMLHCSAIDCSGIAM